MEGSKISGTIEWSQNVSENSKFLGADEGSRNVSEKSKLSGADEGSQGVNEKSKFLGSEEGSQSISEKSNCSKNILEEIKMGNCTNCFEILKQWDYSIQQQRRPRSKSAPRRGGQIEDRGRSIVQTDKPNSAYQNFNPNPNRAYQKRLAHNQKRAANYRTMLKNGMTYGQTPSPPPPPGLHEMFTKFATLYIKSDKPISRNDLIVVPEF